MFPASSISAPSPTTEAEVSYRPKKDISPNMDNGPKVASNTGCPSLPLHNHDEQKS